MMCAHVVFAYEVITLPSVIITPVYTFVWLVCRLWLNCRCLFCLRSLGWPPEIVNNKVMQSMTYLPRMLRRTIVASFNNCIRDDTKAADRQKA